MSHQFGKCLAWSPSWAHKNNVKRVTFSVWFSLLGLWTYVVRVVWPHLASLSTILLFLQTRPQLVTLLKQWRGSAYLCRSLPQWVTPLKGQWRFCHSWLHHWRGSAYLRGFLPQLVTPLKGQCIFMQSWPTRITPQSLVLSAPSVNLGKSWMPRQEAA